MNVEHEHVTVNLPPPPLLHSFYCRHMASNPSSEKLWITRLYMLLIVCPALHHTLRTCCQITQILDLVLDWVSNIAIKTLVGPGFSIKTCSTLAPQLSNTSLYIFPLFCEKVGHYIKRWYVSSTGYISHLSHTRSLQAKCFLVFKDLFLKTYMFLVSKHSYIEMCNMYNTPFGKCHLKNILYIPL